MDVTGHADGQVVRWVAVAPEGARAVTLDRLDGMVQALAVTPDAAWLAAGGDDKTARFWDTPTARELCRLLNFKDESWAVVDKEGRYDADQGGDIDGLHWVIRLEAISLDQLKELAEQATAMRSPPGLEGGA